MEYFLFVLKCLVMSITLESLVCKQKCTSNVWSYFGFVPKSDNNNQPKDPNELICKICFKEKGTLPKPVRIADSNTSNLFSHLCAHHAEVHSQLKAAMEKAKQPIDEQITIKTAAKDGCFLKSNLYSHGSNKWKDLMDSVMHCIAKDMLPIRIVEKEGFKGSLQWKNELGLYFTLVLVMKIGMCHLMTFHLV